MVAATLEVIAEQGFTGASLEAIARRAGVTRGSIYSNFADRDDLLMAAVASQGMSLDRGFSEKAPLRVALRGFAERLFEQFPATANGGALVIEYQLYAMSQPRQRERLRAVYDAMFRQMSADLARQYEGELALGPHALALAIQALAMGFVWQFMLTPGAVRRGDVVAAFDALAVGAGGGS